MYWYVFCPLTFPLNILILPLPGQTCCKAYLFVCLQLRYITTSFLFSDRSDTQREKNAQGNFPVSRSLLFSG